VILDAIITPMYTNSIALLSLNEVADTLLLSTHTIPLETTLGYLKTFLGDLEVEILGIPVKNLEIGFEMSSEVRELIDKLVQCLK
jgi:hydrogenase maturation protease